MRISPDGTRIAFLAPVGGVLNLWLTPIADMGPARSVTAVTDRNLGAWIVWMHEGRHAVFFRNQGGDENWRAWRVDLQTGDARPLTPGPGVTCFVQQTSLHFPSELLIVHNERDRRHFDIHRVDAVDWAVAKGIADPARIGIMGTSYGGYAALVGLTFTPEKFACAVDVVGISNLVTFLKTIPEYWTPWKSVWKVRMGDYTTAAGQRFLEERSPLNFADRIVRPLLIGQGANDVRVKASESEQIVAPPCRNTAFP